VRCSLAVAFFGSFFGKGKKNRETCFTTKTRRISFSKEAENENGHWSLVISHWSLVIGHWSLVISKEVEKIDREGIRETVSTYRYGIKNISGWEAKSQRNKWNFQRCHSTFVNIHYPFLCHQRYMNLMTFAP